MGKPSNDPTITMPTSTMRQRKALAAQILKARMADNLRDFTPIVLGLQKIEDMPASPTIITCMESPQNDPTITPRSALELAGAIAAFAKSLSDDQELLTEALWITRLAIQADRSALRHSVR